VTGKAAAQEREKRRRSQRKSDRKNFKNQVQITKFKTPTRKLRPRLVVSLGRGRICTGTATTTQKLLRKEEKREGQDQGKGETKKKERMRSTEEK